MTAKGLKTVFVKGRLPGCPRSHLPDEERIVVLYNKPNYSYLLTSPLVARHRVNRLLLDELFLTKPAVFAAPPGRRTVAVCLPRQSP